ncbi:type I restriction enzyme HsdR N-terminal domain-containing protein [Flectobacillus sp. DC10W]|jgi:hypothetical protein|uniref:Type I restriction enzyme HsdR N-terminal domain-containing protein n=1 Tax=Flectobacillus longus TaxID=2984207 RepID=A0ABT6YUY3_9BACT|nr:type I restriction enzyme HsdR N-terminal domain-containing protein [Flectobacillus longus]MDI9866936.1 type I restriction enzyme HsdR N-terminal domain-containing protein [Flectobacillus longus]
MELLNLPTFDYKLQKKDGKLYIFDQLRKKYLFLTPEEWVRQHFVNYLIVHLAYPKSLIKLESGLSYNNVQKRTDIQVFDRMGQLFMVIECKAPYVPLTQAVFEQVAQYNHTLRSPYVVITNGMSQYCCQTNWDTFQINFLENLPLFP